MDGVACAVCKIAFSSPPINRGRVNRGFPVVIIGIKQTRTEENRLPGACLVSCRAGRVQLDRHNNKQPFCCYGNNFYVVVNYRSLFAPSLLLYARTHKT